MRASIAQSTHSASVRSLLCAVPPVKSFCQIRMFPSMSLPVCCISISLRSVFKSVLYKLPPPR